MNLFEIFSNITHPAKKNGWIETVAFFTGKYEKAAFGRHGCYGSAGYNEYQVRYYTAEGERMGWYAFFPVPDPDPEDIIYTSIRIRYKERKPWVFEVIEEID
jgi:hypothetical protein